MKGTTISIKNFFFIIAVVVELVGFNAFLKAQPNIEISFSSSNVLPDSVYLHSVDTFGLRVKNNGDALYSGLLELSYNVFPDTLPLFLDTIGLMLAPGEEKVYHNRFILNFASSPFVIGNNVLVIWPTEFKDNKIYDSLFIDSTCKSSFEVTIDEEEHRLKTSNQSYGAGSLYYEWHINEEMLSHDQTIIKSIDSINTSINISLIIQDTNGCADVETKNILIEKSESASPSNYKFSISPNPSQGIMTIINSLDNEIIKITLVDILGKSFELNISPDDKIDISAFPKGLYFVDVFLDKIGIIRKSVVKI